MRIYTLLLTFLVTFLFQGCAKSPQTREHNIPPYTQVGVVIHDYNISIQNNINVGLGAGLGDTTSKCFKEAPRSLAAPAPAGIFFFLSPIICPTLGLTYGTTRGAIEGYQFSKTTERHGTIQSKIQYGNITKNLEDALISYMQENAVNTKILDSNVTKKINYATLFTKGIDKIIEVDDVELYFRQLAIADVPVIMTLQVDSRLINTKNSEQLAKISFTFSSNIHPYEEWVINNFKVLEEEYKVLIEQVTSALVDEYLLLYYPKLSDEITSIERGRNVPYYMLQPKEPELDFTGWGAMGGALTLPNGGYSFQVVVEVEEEKPLFKWEAFPWEHDLVSKENFSDVVYDFKIYQHNGICIYARNGLKENWHQVEKKLEEDITYFWSVRARFNYNGQCRVTEWSAYTAYNPLQVREDMNNSIIYYMPQFYNYFPFEIEKLD